MDTKLNGKVLLTGASGFVGGRLRERLLADGVDVVAIRRSSSPAPKAGRSVVAEYDDLETLERVFAEEKPDYVLHVAGVTKGVTYEDFRRGNVMPTENLLRAARKAHPSLERFVLVSSLAAYGPSNEGPPRNESHPKQPVEFYGRSKVEAEAVLEVDRTLPWTIIRPAGVYGPGDVDYLELYKGAHRGVNLYFGNAHKRMSVVYVDDLVDAILAASKSPNTVHRGYFVADGEICTWRDYQEEMKQEAGRRVFDVSLPGFLVPIAAQAGELVTKLDGKPRLFNRQKATMDAQDAWTCAIENAQKDFGYVPRVNRREGIRRTFEWYRREGWL